MTKEANTMKIEALKPNIVRIAIHQEQGDPHYGS